MLTKLCNKRRIEEERTPPENDFGLRVSAVACRLFERGLLNSTSKDRYYFFRLRNGGDAGCELTEERSDAWEPYIANPEA